MSRELVRNCATKRHNLQREKCNNSFCVIPVQQLTSVTTRRMLQQNKEVLSISLATTWTLLDPSTLNNNSRNVALHCAWCISFSTVNPKLFHEINIIHWFVIICHQAIAKQWPVDFLDQSLPCMELKKSCKFVCRWQGIIHLDVYGQGLAHTKAFTWKWIIAPTNSNLVAINLEAGDLEILISNICLNQERIGFRHFTC